MLFAFTLLLLSLLTSIALLFFYWHTMIANQEFNDRISLLRRSIIDLTLKAQTLLATTILSPSYREELPLPFTQPEEEKIEFLGN